ncbi:ROK family glucokinase [Vibrio ishigakensis]|uniref:ROK family glucokinase n=1 Tax=Vibrio ishigakensis TaxID=1481914 RepID=A0A0B8QFL3_9VIBR|nr:ROK family glucokinase [Vibrio ishigakensis]
MLVGFDIGGTKIEVKVLTEQGEELLKFREPTPDNYSDFIALLQGMLIKVEGNLGAFNKVGLGLPGAVCPKTGLIKNANTLFLNGKNVAKDLSDLTGKSVTSANDANCFALSEAVDGAGKGEAVVFGAILGTGCGGGVVINEQVLVGANAIGGEWGHNPLPSYNPEIDGDIGPCYCGRQHCIEQYISGTGFADQFNKKYSKSLNAREIIELYQQGDKEATEAYQLLVDQMARSFAALTNIIDPHAIVLGGGLSNVESLYQDLPAVMKKYVFSKEPSINVQKAKFGDSSGVRGAAWLAR